MDSGTTSLQTLKGDFLPLRVVIKTKRRTPCNLLRWIPLNMFAIHYQCLFSRCFDRFFRMVNINEHRLSAWRRGFITENVDLVGLEYLWKAVLLAPDSIVYKPIELLKDVYTNLSNKLQQDQVQTNVFAV